MLRFRIGLILALCVVPRASAGLYYSAENFAELPSQWRGFLLDQRLLRNIAVKAAAGVIESPARKHYQAEAQRLAAKSTSGNLSADDAADLGALYLRLGETAKALDVLHTAQRENPEHFRLAANLGTAFQLHGDLSQAASLLQLAVRLAPGKHLRVEELHLKLVRMRGRQPADATALDDLFGVAYTGPSGKYEPGSVAAEQKKKLPLEAVALVQALALSLPADGRLLWQLAELAALNGDIATAAAMMDGCVTEFGLRDVELRGRRQAMRAAADEIATAGAASPRAAHGEGHASRLKTRSSRPLPHQFDAVTLPPIDPKGINPIPWSVVTETVVDREYRPTFGKYLKELDGKRVELTGYMQPLGDEPDVGPFLLIEYPVGCWYCEMPGIANIVLVEQPPGKRRHVTRGSIRITGTLSLNASDPENFLYTIRQAKIVDAD